MLATLKKQQLEITHLRSYPTSVQAICSQINVLIKCKVTTFVSEQKFQ